MIPYFYLTIPSYSLLAFLGGLAAVVYAYTRSVKFSMNIQSLLRTAIIVFICLFLGARALFVITQIPSLIYSFSLEKLFDVTVNGGLVFYGGLFGAIIGLHISATLFKIDKNKVMNVVIPCFPLFHIFGRLGCFLTGCCYGKLLYSPIVIYGITIERVPTQLIEALCELGIFIFLFIYERKSTSKINILKVYLLIYSACRFIIEFFRGDTVRGILFGLSTAQWISIMIWGYYIIKFIKDKNERTMKDV